MASFAERYGFRAPRSVIQVDDLDDSTRIGIWNSIQGLTQVLNEHDSVNETRDRLLAHVWAVLLEQSLDEQPRDAFIWRAIKTAILEDEWWEVLDLLERIVRRIDDVATWDLENLSKVVVENVNFVFATYLVGYRFVDLQITPVDSEEELRGIEEGLADAAAFGGARTHLARALEHLSDRQAPDYANSIKESISAVEAVCRDLTGEGTLGAALRELDTSGVSLHPALRGAWSKMYGWTSDADGIRHGSIAESDATQGLAKYMLVTCSSFVSYLSTLRAA